MGRTAGGRGEQARAPESAEGSSGGLAAFDARGQQFTATLYGDGYAAQRIVRRWSAVADRTLLANRAKLAGRNTIAQWLPTFARRYFAVRPIRFDICFRLAQALVRHGCCAVISFTDLKRDPRVRRQIDALRGSHSVIAAGTGDPELPDVRFVGCQRAPRTIRRKLTEAFDLLAHRYEAHYARLAHVRDLGGKLVGTAFDVAIANDVEALPLALDLAGSRPVILDAHEYAPREVEERLLWRVFKQGHAHYLCRTYLKRTARMITVSDGIADEYARVFGVSPSVVSNAAAAHALKPRPTQARPVRMIHHGHAMPTRGIESMIELMRASTIASNSS
jgi:hypothetical protein